MSDAMVSWPWRVCLKKQTPKYNHTYIHSSLGPLMLCPKFDISVSILNYNQVKSCWGPFNSNRCEQNTRRYKQFID